MKRFIPLFVALFFSTICFAQNNVSIKDFCYYDRDMNTIETHSQDQIIKSLKKKRLRYQQDRVFQRRRSRWLRNYIQVCYYVPETNRYNSSHF